MTDYPHVYFAGRWVGARDATVPVGSLALRYALSAFEGIRLYHRHDRSGTPRPLLLDEHVARLVGTLRLMRLPDPGVDRLPELIDELIERNGITTDAYVRVAVTPVIPGDLSTEPADPDQVALSVTAVPMGRKPWVTAGRGMSLAISPWQRPSAAAFPTAAKNISTYAGPRLAWLAARDEGHDGCVLTNAQGRLTEAATATLFLVVGGALVTPPLDEGVLPGVTRAWILRNAADWGLTAREAPLTAADARSADEAFLCGTGIEIAAVRGFDGHDCRQWPESPVTRQVTIHYFSTARGAPAEAVVP